MFVNFHGVEIKVPDNTKCVTMDGKSSGYAVHANKSADLIWKHEWNEWCHSFSWRDGEFTHIDLSKEDKAKIRSIVKPKNSLVRISKKG